MRAPTAGAAVLAAAAALRLASCAPADAPEGASVLPLLSLSEPFLEIGVVEGDERYTFDEVTSVLARPDGTILVADGGATEITLYDADGAFVRRWGRRGEGPGELRSLSRILPHGTDSILALDTFEGRASVFGVDGGFGRLVDAADLSGDTVFRLDVWLHGRFWVDGALGPDERARVRGVLDRLPPPREAPGYRFVRVARDGTLWVREPDAGGVRGERRWTVLDGDGRPTGVVRVPLRFDPLHIDRGRVLGRWLGESDVAFVRGYRVEETGATDRTPGWLVRGPSSGAPSTSQTSGPEGGPPAAPPDAEAFLTLVRGAIRTMAMAQEIHYSHAMTYTTLVDSLEWERPEEILVDFVAADRRGWAAVFAHPGADRICGLGYGAAVPPGWLPGAIVCAPEER